MNTQSKMGDVFPIFPTPLYLADIEINDDELSFIENLQDYRDVTPTGNEVSRNIKILKLPQIKNINEQINRHLRYFSTEILRNSFELRTTISWINRKTKGAYHHEHIHPNSIVSGVLYFSDCQQIVFSKNELASYTNTISDANPKEENMFNSKTFFVNPSRGKLVMFPSYLRHHVAENKLNDTRYSLSFNTFPSLSVGSAEDLTFVDFMDLI